MKIFAIGDLHLSFCEDVQKPMDVFGSLWEEHALRLRENWLSAVNHDDIVILCGDISWGLRIHEAEADLRWLDTLPGKKVIFKGNHDLWWQSAGKLNFRYGSDSMIFLQNGAYTFETENGTVSICGSRGWKCPGEADFDQHDRRIYERELIRLRMSLEEGQKAGGRIIGALHFPPTNDMMQPSGFTEMMSEFGVTTCVYGHLHGVDSFKRGLKGIFNGVRYELVSLDYLEAFPREVKI